MSGPPNSRTLRFALSRPKVITPIALAIFFTTVVGLWWLGLGFAVLAFYRVTHILSYSDLEDRLRLRDQRCRHGMAKKLSAAERAEVLRIDRYARNLTDSGVGSGLADDILERMWTLIKNERPQDAARSLRAFFAGLPQLPEQRGAAAGDDLGRRIQEELDLIRAARTEVEAAT